MKSSNLLLKRFIEEHTDNIKGLNTGFSKFDKFTNGLQAGQLIVIAGRPGMGCLAFTKCLLLNTSIRHNNPIYIFSLEKSAKFYIETMIATEADMNLHEFKRVEHSDAELLKLNQSIEKIGNSPIYIDDSLPFTVSSLLERARETIKKDKIKLFVIQGFDLLMIEDSSNISRKQELDLIAKKLKQFSKDFNVALVINYSLPSMLQKVYNEDNIPVIKDLYNSSPLGKYADLVAFVYRPEYYGIKFWYNSNECCANEAKLIITKNRNGYLNDFRLCFDSHISKFTEYDDGFF